MIAGLVHLVRALYPELGWLVITICSAVAVHEFKAIWRKQ